MTKYAAKITKDADGDFYALIIRVDYDGQENVINGYTGRFFKTRKAAERSTANYMKKWGLK